MATSFKLDIDLKIFRSSAKGRELLVSLMAISFIKREKKGVLI